MNIAGITRVRNEESIIKQTLDHVAHFVDKIYVYDDASTDKTPYICRAHPSVAEVIIGKEWASDPVGRNKAEGDLRQAVYELARADGAEWVYYFDADEYVYPIENLEYNTDGYFFRLYDFYITPRDENLPFSQREWIGPEYRDIKMMFPVTDDLRFYQREPSNIGQNIQYGGDVKHFGKAISVEEWERTCDYYINHRGGDHIPMFTNKWMKRKGKAIHTESDFGHALIKWEDRNKSGFPLIDTDI